MAKVTAPMLSLDAKGSFGDTMTYGSWKGIKYARFKATPANPNTAGQQAQRTTFSNAVAGWKAQDGTTQTTWNERAATLGLKMSGFNLWTREFISQGCAEGESPTLP